MDQFENTTAKEWASGAYQLDIEATIKELERFRALVTAVEWGGRLDGGRMGQCPWCAQHKDAGHAADCPAFTTV
jgi:hypothetical protein